MTNAQSSRPRLTSLADIERFEQAEPIERRIPGTVYDLFRRSAEVHPGRTALAMVKTGEADETAERLTYRALLGAITQTANLFSAVGGPGVGVAYILPSLFETHVTLWAAETAGFAVPLNPLLTIEHLAALIQTSGASVLVTCGPEVSPDIWKKAEALKARLPHLAVFSVASPRGSRISTDLTGAASEHHSGRLTFLANSDPHGVVAFFHTGGTTGAPKLVAHTHRNQLAAAFGVSVLLDLGEADVVTNGMPLFHVGGAIAASLAFFLEGATVLMLSPTGLRNPAMVSNFWRIAERQGVTVLGAVPTSWSAILEQPVDADLSGVRLALTGSAPTPRGVETSLSAVTGLRLHQILGMTETGGATAVVPAGIDAATGSVGLRLPYTTVSVRRRLPDGGPGARCLPGETGLLLVAGPTVSPGYLDPEQNAGVFTSDGLSSGDLARFNDAGELFICGRAKDVIIRSGHNIDPATIEATLLSHPAVGAAAAVAQPDTYAGEVPVAYVVLRPGARTTPSELLAFASLEIAERPALPKAIRLLDALPMTAVGKVYLPGLRLDAMEAAARDLLEQRVPDARVSIEAHETGTGELGLTVLVGDGAHMDTVRRTLEGFTFASTVRQAD